jgi:nucleosome binding factor SPN SPT16 subunit
LWFVDSKEFDLLVVGGLIGIRVREKCKQVTRSILLDKDEASWLIKSYDKLVTVQDSRVFWNHSLSGCPWILAHQCSNRHGYFW